MQWTALFASSEIGIDEAVKKFSETNKRVRKTLGNLGIMAIKSLPKFQMPAARDDDPYVHKEAQRAIQMI
jgi:hypothetical protein